MKNYGSSQKDDSGAAGRQAGATARCAGSPHQAAGFLLRTVLCGGVAGAGSLVSAADSLSIHTVFRIVLALAAAGIAGVIPGMIRLKAQPGTALLIHAGGALAVFVMIYLLAPAALPPEEKSAKKKAAPTQFAHQLIQGNNNTAINIEKGNVEVKYEE